MHGLRASMNFFPELASSINNNARADVLICPPATLIHEASVAAHRHGIWIGGQDCHANDTGAHTGEISAAMLRDAGASHVVVGHSERRCDHAETDAQVCAKALGANRGGLIPVICVGESLEQRDAGEAQSVVAGQLANSVPESLPPLSYVVAYEPVWAIGTGKTASSGDIQDMHAFIRKALPQGELVRILYGGSVKPSNAADILALPDVDGALVGGASLKAADFAAIVNSSRS